MVAERGEPGPSTYRTPTGLTKGIINARPLRPLPMSIANLEQIAHLDMRRRQRLGGILHEDQHPVRTGRMRRDRPPGCGSSTGREPRGLLPRPEPDFTIEFAHQRNMGGTSHIHAVYRENGNDYGAED